MECRDDNGVMETAAELVRAARRRRQLTQKELTQLSGVPASTLSRIEGGVVDPAYGTVVKLLRTMGFRPGTDLFEESTDEQLERAILSGPTLAERFDVYRVAAQVSPVAARRGAQTVTAALDELLADLEDADVSYAFSALEGFYGGWPAEGSGSFWPVVYVDPAFERPWPEQPLPGLRGTVYVLPMTDRAARFMGPVNSIVAMSPEWSIIDTIASPERQSDVGLELLAAIDDNTRRLAA